MPSRIEQALDRLDATIVRAWGVGGITLIEPKADAMLTVLRAAAELQTAAIAATAASISYNERTLRRTRRDRAITALGTALDSLAASVLGEVPGIEVICGICGATLERAEAGPGGLDMFRPHECADPVLGPEKVPTDEH